MGTRCAGGRRGKLLVPPRPLAIEGHAHGDARALAEQLPSRRSRDYGRPFAEIFASFNRDFYAIDPMLFAPAAVIVTAAETGESFHAGGLDLGLLDAAFQ